MKGMAAAKKGNETEYQATCRLLVQNYLFYIATAEFKNNLMTLFNGLI